LTGHRHEFGPIRVTHDLKCEEKESESRGRVKLSFFLYNRRPNLAESEQVLKQQIDPNDLLQHAHSQEERKSTSATNRSKRFARTCSPNRKEDTTDEYPIGRNSCLVLNLSICVSSINDTKQHCKQSRISSSVLFQSIWQTFIRRVELRFQILQRSVPLKA